MPALSQFLGMIVAQQAGAQTLDRTEEPSRVTDAVDNVLQYDQVMLSKLVLIYAVGLEIVHRARPSESTGTKAVDLACGPGHYTLSLTRHTGLGQVTGVDLSAPMVATANRNAASQGLADRVGFRKGDITQLGDVPTASIDLSSFTGAAHHMPDLETVGRIIREMDRITRPDGLIMVMDLARLRTAKLTERYVNVLGRDYLDRGLKDFFDDFRNTMYAGWTTTEFATAIPRDSQRSWCHLVPRGLPTFQVALGLPVGRRQVFVRPGWPATENPLIKEWYPRWRDQVSPQWADETLKDWKLTRLGLKMARKRMIPPGQAVDARP